MSDGTGEAPPLGLPMTAVKEQLSLAYLRVVVAAAGCWIKNHETDYDGVDITIASSAEYERFFGPQFEVQLKCTSQMGKVKDDHVSWSMPAKPFRKLTNPKRYLDAYLGVLVIPDEPDTWLHQNEDRLLVKSCMYWECAANLGSISDEDQESKTVKLARTNLFDVDSLLGIMRFLGERSDR